MLSSSSDSSQNASLFLAPEWAIKYLQARLLNAVIPEPNTGCWFFLQSSQHDGRGRISFMGKAISASRASYIAFIGPIPSNLNVLHTCDIPECICPSHLYLGTQSNNTLDAVKRKKHNTQKLTTKDILEIRGLWPKFSQPVIAKMYGITDSNVNCILKRKTWKHV